MSRGRAWEHYGRRAGYAAWLTCVAGCAHQEARPVTPAVADNAELSALREQLAERDVRIGRLENRIALLEAAQRELRYALLERDMAAPEAPRQPERAAPTRVTTTPEAEASEGPRPVLRLHEDRRRGASTAQAGLMPVPVADERLPVAPVPSLRDVAGQLEQPAVDPDVLYRRALDLVRQRDFPAALQVLDTFLQRFMDHPRAAKVMFWRGEVLFAQRDYARALAAYERALVREPRGEKAPDALLKISLCHRHLGSPESARSALERLKSQFPDSDAARLVQREDA